LGRDQALLPLGIDHSSRCWSACRGHRAQNRNLFLALQARYRLSNDSASRGMHTKPALTMALRRARARLDRPPLDDGLLHRTARLSLDVAKSQLMAEM